MAQIKETYMTKQIKLHAEVRKVEELDNSFTSKDGKQIESKAIAIKVDDDDGERVELIDRSSDHLTGYKRGMMGTFTLRLDLEKKFGVGKYDAVMTVIDFKEDEE